MSVRWSASRRGLVVAGLWVAALVGSVPALAAPPESPAARALIRPGDRIAWVGSSSTRIGVWPRTVEFLLRTRHPDLDLRFERFTTGAGTFATGVERLDGWLDGYNPTLVIFNYGGNDAAAGREGLTKFQDNMERCVALVRAKGARVVFVTPQAADDRKAGALPAARRALYAETMLSYGRERGWTVIDVHHPLEAMQRANQRDDPAYTILKDTIHLTDPAYVGWGFLFYDRLDLPLARSDAVVSADGRVIATENCKVQDVQAHDGGVSFTRLDRVLPILPPGPPPPRFFVPLEAQSRYLLAVTGLPPGDYDIVGEGRLIGTVGAAALAVGVNLNTLLLDDGREAPWSELAKSLWDGKDLDRVGQARWKFEVRKH